MRYPSGAGDLSLFFPCPGASDPLSDLKSGSISSETTLVPGGEPRAGLKGDGVWRAAVARLRLSWVGGESGKTCPPDRGERSFCCLPEFHVWVWVRSGSHVCDCNAGIRSYFLASTIRPAQFAEFGFGKVFSLAWDRFPSWRLVWALQYSLDSCSLEYSPKGKPVCISVGTFWPQGSPELNVEPGRS